MSVSLLSSSVYASEELFDGGVSTETELTDEQANETEGMNAGDTDDSADPDIADDEDAASDVEVTEEDTEDESGEVSDVGADETDTGEAFSDGIDDIAEFSAGDAVGDTEPVADAI